jgi:sulfotransferase
MNKQYFFLAGLPRSGNTLLSSILNQNPDIQVSANSLISEIFYYGVSLQFNEVFQNFPDYDSLENYLRSIFDSYYQNWDAKYIIDRGPWGTENNLNILENLFGDDIKIICTVRDITEILASFIKLNPKWIDNQITEQLNSGVRFNHFHKSDIELKCEVLMSPTGQIDKNLSSLSNLFQKPFIHIKTYGSFL